LHSGAIIVFFMKIQAETIWVNIDASSAPSIPAAYTIELVQMYSAL
jgi:hypothetical protein